MFEPNIRWMIHRDMAEVVLIEAACFDWPWNYEDFIRTIRQRNVIGMVVTIDESLAGYMIYILHKNSVTILNFAVTPTCRRLGLGTLLIDKLKSKLSEKRRTAINFTLADTNLCGHLFLRSCGFKATGVRRDYFDDPTTDGYDFQYNHTSQVLCTQT